MSMITDADASIHVVHDIPPFTSLGGMPLTPERTELIEKARALVPRLRERSAQTNRDRKLPDETIAELRESGLLDVRRPREFGGVEIDNQTYVDVIGEIARGCGSTAWTTGIVNDIWFLAGTVLPDQGRTEFYASGLSGTAPFYPRKGGTCRKVEGGYQIDYGEWPWASGSQIAGWAIVRANLLDEDGEISDVMAPMIPMDELEVLDEWHTIAMRGSASNTLKIENVFIPEHRAGSMSRVLTGQHIVDMPDFQRQPWLTGVVFGLVPIAIGLARHALEVFLERSQGRPIATTTYGDSAAAPRTQLLVAEAAQKIDAADLLLHRGAAMLDLWAGTGAEPSVAERVKARADFAYASKLSIEAVQMLFRETGASALAQGSPLAQVAMDINAIPMHAAFNPTTGLENYGAALTGRTPPAESFGEHVYV
jgi:3-hydroxy-9,10-secoandrosta-1,3,5(10)-triene-9,17-dione monooxygenase